MSSIKLTNDVKINSQSLELLGLDVNNLIASITLNYDNTYTAPNDCFIFVSFGAGASGNFTFTFNLDGTNISDYSGNAAYASKTFVPVKIKKGQLVKTNQAGGTNYMRIFVYGLK